MTVDEFHKWWLGPHAAKGKKIPGMKRYVISLAADVSKDFWQPGEPGQDYDGICEILFESEEDMRKAFASEEIAACIEDAANHNITEVAKNFYIEHLQDIS